MHRTVLARLPDDVAVVYAARKAAVHLYHFQGEASVTHETCDRSHVSWGEKEEQCQDFGTLDVDHLDQLDAGMKLNRISCAEFKVINTD